MITFKNELYNDNTRIIKTKKKIFDKIAALRRLLQEITIKDFQHKEPPLEKQPNSFATTTIELTHPKCVTNSKRSYVQKCNQLKLELQLKDVEIANLREENTLKREIEKFKKQKNVPAKQNENAKNSKKNKKPRFDSSDEFV